MACTETKIAVLVGGNEASCSGEARGAGSIGGHECISSENIKCIGVDRWRRATSIGAKALLDCALRALVDRGGNKA